MQSELEGKSLNGWTLGALLGQGKSALVLEARRGDELAAVKVFDRELVKHYGKTAQVERIRREGLLVGKTHPNLIRILDTGDSKEHDVLFVVMKLVDARTLESVRGLVPQGKIRRIVAQIASAAKFLEDLGLAHRDIKPENVSISEDFDTAVLLDLGVIKPIGLAGITDQADQRHFVGTLQYGPPELLVRDEVDSVEGWRAVTFYQLGALLHDLLTGRRLFEDYVTPYPLLAEAVRDVPPHIHAPGAPPDLCLLATNCLVKSPKTRLQLATWESFREQAPDQDEELSALGRIRKRAIAKGASITLPPQAPARPLSALGSELQQYVREAVSSTGYFPPHTLSCETIEDDLMYLDALFPASDRRSVSSEFRVRFALKQNDELGVSHAVTAFLDMTGEAKTPAEASSGRQIFLGVWDRDTVRRRIARAMVVALDLVQQLSEGAVKPGPITWPEDS